MKYFDEDNIEQLSVWLSKELEPLTLADPDTLAEYVIALLKHDKDSHDLKEFCKEELADFLKENTEPFVKLLFEALEDRRYFQSASITAAGGDDEDEVEVDGTVGYRRGRGDDDDDDDRDSRRRDSRRRDSDDNKRQRGAEREETDVNSSRSSKPYSTSGSLTSNRSYNDGRSGRSDISPQQDHRRSDYHDRNKGYNKDNQNRAYGDRQPRGYPYSSPEFAPPMDPMMGGYGYPPQMIHPHMGAPIGYPYSTMGLNMDMGFPGASYDETGMMKPAAPPTLPIHANEVSTTTAVAGSVPAPPPGPMPPRGPVGPAATWAAPGYPPSMSSYYAGAAYGYSGSAQAPPLPPSSALAGPVTGFNYNSMYPTQYGGAPLSTPYGSNLGTGAGSSGGGNRNRDGGQRRQGSNQTPKNELPENERFTLLCTGIPKYIKEEEMMTHFKAFGRVVQLQVTASDTTPAASADATSTDEKKTYNECLVQFGSFEDAKKCFSSPEAVLNNRFIRIQQSSFNIIPPADVAPATVEELQEIETIQMNKSAAAKAKATGVTVPLATGPPRPRAPRPVVPLGKPAKNKKYIAGITPVSAPATTATTTKPAINTTATESGDSDHADGNNNKESNISDDATATTDAKEGTDGEETGAESTEIDPSSSDTNQTPSKHSKTTRPIVSAAPTKATMALQQQYDDLRKLRGQVDNIWKTKHNLLQGQIDKYHEMITLLSKIPSDKNTSTIEELESKIVDLQSQLRVIQEQQETGTLQAAQPVQQSSSDSTFSGGRGGRGGRGASFGRFGRGFTPYAGRSGGSGRMGGRWHPGVRGGSVASKNMSIDNRPRSLLVPASEWIQLPATFTANVKTHFSKFGEVKSMNSQSNGDIIIEYNTRREAEIAKSNGAVYENTPIHIDWYGNSNIQGGGMNDQNNNGGSDVMMTE